MCKNPAKAEREREREKGPTWQELGNNKQESTYVRKSQNLAVKRSKVGIECRDTALHSKAASL